MWFEVQLLSNFTPSLIGNFQFSFLIHMYICSFSLSFPSFSLFSTFSLSFSIWVWRRCGWLRGFVDFITGIFSGMKLNANTEQIEGKLYFNIRGNFSLKFGWGRSLIKHVYTIIMLLFKAFSSFLCLKEQNSAWDQGHQRLFCISPTFLDCIWGSSKCKEYFGGVCDILGNIRSYKSSWRPFGPAWLCVSCLQQCDSCNGYWILCNG